MQMFSVAAALLIGSIAIDGGQTSSGEKQAKTKETEVAARAAADKAHKASAYASLWLFISLLCGAFVASLAATFGGRRRDLF